MWWVWILRIGQPTQRPTPSQSSKKVWPNGRKKTEVINAPQKRRGPAGITTPQNGDFFPPLITITSSKRVVDMDFSNLWGSASGIFCVWLVASGQCFPEAKWPVEMGRNGWMMGSWNGRVNEYCKWLGCNACWYLQIKSYLYYPYSPMSIYDMYIFIYTYIYIYRLL